jgi:hypothetical protein
MSPSIFGISSTRVLTPEGLRKATVLIKDGKITDVVESASGSSGSSPSVSSDYEIQDVGDAVVMPGLATVTCMSTNPVAPNGKALKQQHAPRLPAA